jgi:uncharacterized protein YceK
VTGAESVALGGWENLSVSSFDSRARLDYCFSAMRRPLLLALVVVAVGLSGCSTIGFVEQKEKDKAEVRAALEKYLNERGTINLAAMDWRIEEFSQDRDNATVQVIFTAKQGGAQMPVTYQLRKENGVWQVQKTPGSSGHPGVMPQSAPPEVPSSGQLPTGHPAIGGTPAPAKTPAPAPAKKP